MERSRKSLFLKKDWNEFCKLLTIILLISVISSSNSEEKEEEKEKTKEEGKEEIKEEGKELNTEETAKDIRSLRPHIIFILADDLGWNDLSLSGFSQIPTPNIDALASSSLILSNYYTEVSCTPSRASLLTGKYPIHIGLQHFGIHSGEPTALPLDIKTMPEHLKKLDYTSHIVGKWHLGYSKKEFTPTYRGFDSFFGFYNDQIDYFDYTNYEKSSDSTVTAFYGVDLQSGTDPVKNLRGRYATEVFTEKAVEIIEKHNDSKPLFLYVSHLACHSGNEYMPLQAPFSMINQVGNITDSKRRTYAGVVKALDESVGKIVDALYRRDFMQNAIIVFTSDSGSAGQDGSSSWPLRGRQPAVWEGAIHVPGFIWSPLLQLKEPRTAKQLMHVSDWLPTLFSAAGGDISQLDVIDGLNLWKTFITDSQSTRMEILHNINLVYDMSALRRGDYKLVKGTAPGDNNLWYGSPESPVGDLNMTIDDWLFLNGSIVKPILQKLDMWLPLSDDSWRKNITIQCEQPPPADSEECNPNENPCLFNIAADPCEYKNLARRYPRIVRSMLKILNKYNGTILEPLTNTTDPRANPRCHGFSYVPWLDEEYAMDCSNL